MSNRRRHRRSRYVIAEPTQIRVSLPRVVLASEQEWLAVRTAPRHESRLQAFIASNSSAMLVHRPVTAWRHTRRGRLVIAERSELPGFVFVGAAAAQQILDLLHALAHWVDIHWSALGPLRAVELQRFFDYLTGKLGDFAVDQPFFIGQHVMVRHGPLEGKGAVVTGVSPATVTARVTLFARQIITSFSPSVLEAT